MPKLDCFMMGYKDRRRFGAADPKIFYDRAGNSNPVVVKGGIVRAVIRPSRP